MEKTSSNTFSLAGVVGLFFFERIVKRVIGFHKFYSTSQSFFQSQLEFLSGNYSKAGRFERKVSVCNPSVNEDDGALSKEDVKMVIAKLNIVLNQDGDLFQERLGLDEMSAVFEEEEPSLDEVKEAFHVFDDNEDGYIDATDLQRVLSCLGFREASDVTQCEKMIRVFDENKDGLIDFHEFVKLMENSFC